MGKQNNN